jgi:integrase
VLNGVGSQKYRLRGLQLLLDWLSDQPGGSWQQRWMASGVDAAAAGWRQIPADWLHRHGRFNPGRHRALCAAVVVVIAADLVRPSLAWLVAAGTRSLVVVHDTMEARDPDGFARLRQLCDSDPLVSARGRDHSLHRAALIIAAKGGTLGEMTIGDVLELLDTEAGIYRQPRTHGADFYRMMRRIGAFGPCTPHRLGELRCVGQRTPEELIDRYQLAFRPVRDLLVDYLKERQPGMDYSSLRRLAAYLGDMFWKNLERHHPGIDSLHLPAGVAEAWKQRLRTVSKAVDTAGEKQTVTVERVSYRQCLTPVRAFYLDLAQWAIEDPARWAAWVAPCPISDEEINQRKMARHRKARMDARTRERLPVLPELVRGVAERRSATQSLLHAAQQTRPGQSFTAAGQTLTRASVTRTTGERIWAEDPASGKRRDLTTEEDLAFWAWALVEVLRATGIRVEELLEISHHSMVQYRLPTTGELVPLLQIAPSKTDAERLLVISPELADVLSAIIGRVRGDAAAIPLIPAYDRGECVWQAPTPWLFQRRFGGEQRRMSYGAVRNILIAALARTGLTDREGRPLRFTPHDFRRIFITDTIISGLPPHIAQIIAGHRDINVTLGYKAVYPDEAIQAHLGFLARRRALRPSEEYRVPTDDEWEEFLGHFERRKVSIGTCGRAFATPCIHEHACVRCSLLWPDPSQQDRLHEIRDNLIARVAEAENNGWLGEVEGLRVSLAGAQDKLAQINRRAATTTELGTPSLPTKA